MITVYGVSFQMRDDRLWNSSLITKDVDETEYPWCNFNVEYDMMLYPVLDGSFELYSTTYRLVEIYVSALHMAAGLYDLGPEEVLKNALKEFADKKLIL